MKYLSIFLSLLFSILFLELISRAIIDNGINYGLEMTKYANKLKLISDNKAIGIEHKKNKSAKLMGAEVFLDSDGFRVLNNLDQENPKYKILMLGDSMTFGWGAKKPFANILDEKIKNHHVINAGIGNTNTIMQISNFFENYVDKYEYKLIVLNFFINDFENVIIREPNFFEKYSYLYTVLNNNINTLLIKFKLRKDWKTFYSENYLDKKIKDKTFLYINKLNKYCIENNIKFFIHNIPELKNLKKYRFNKETDLIKDYSKDNNINFYNSIEVLKNFNEEDLWVTAYDHHASDKAHEILAEFLYEKIKENKHIN